MSSWVSGHRCHRHNEVTPVTDEASDSAYAPRTITVGVSQYTVGHADPARGTTLTMTMKAPCNQVLDKLDTGCIMCVHPLDYQGR